MTPAPSTACGTIVLAGRPNVGKSTLLNALVGEPLAIVSPRAQTTRLPVIGLRTETQHQIAFVDPAGLLEPAYLMQAQMVTAAHAALKTADAVLHLHPLADAPAPTLTSLLSDIPPLAGPVLTVYTQADAVAPRTRAALGTAHDALAVSAVSGEGLDALLAWCRAQLPPGPFRYDPEALSTQPVRFFVEEFVREAAFEHLAAEVPYALIAEVDEFRETSDPVYIRVNIYVERESQKGIVVGKGATTLRAIGTRARRRVEAFLGARVYLDLWVKTLPKWRADPAALRRFGFPNPNPRTR